MKGVGLIFKKEWMEFSKDRRTMFFTFVIPLILFPAIFTMMTKMAQGDSNRRRGQASRIVLNDPGEVVKPFLLGDAKAFQLVEAPSGDLKQALRDKKFDLAVDVEAGAPGKLQRQEPFAVKATVDESESGSELALKRLKEAMKKQDQIWVQARLEAIKAPKDLPKPSNLVTEKASDLALELSKMLGMFVPYILLIGLYTNAMQHGVYMTAGEKERHTMLSLLSTAIPRSHVIWGKLLATFSIGVMGTVMNVVGMSLGFTILGHQVAGSEASLAGAAAAPSLSFSSLASPTTLGLTLLLLIPLGLFFSSIILVLGTQAKNSREAMTAITPGIFVVVMLGVFSTAPGLEKMAALPYVPVLNVALTIRKLFSHEFVAWQYILAFVMTSGLAAAMAWLSTSILNRESAIFRQ
ncbi:MAG: ABC transporter permease [Holophagaceae bacterium]|nr:ABC transporter permease [Holophagaceae bacterium]